MNIDMCLDLTMLEGVIAVIGFSAKFLDRFFVWVILKETATEGISEARRV